MKKSKKYDEYKNEAQEFQSMVNHSQRNLELQSQVEESETVAKKVSSKRRGALTKQISN